MVSNNEIVNSVLNRVLVCSVAMLPPSSPLMKSQSRRRSAANC